MRKEEPSKLFFSFGIVSRQEKMSAFVGKQVVLLVHKAAKLFLYCDKKEKKSFVLFAALHYSFFCILIPFTTFMSFGDRFPYCISLFKATSVLQGNKARVQLCLRHEKALL